MKFTPEQDAYLRNIAKDLDRFGPPMNKKGWRRWSRERENAFISFVRNKMMRELPPVPDNREAINRLVVAIQSVSALVILAIIVLIVRSH